jgi:hypothetical protein
VGEACTDNVLLEDVVMRGEAVVCGNANTGTSKEPKTIIFAHILKDAIMAENYFSKYAVQLRGDTEICDRDEDS